LGCGAVRLLFVCASRPHYPIIFSMYHLKVYQYYIGSWFRPGRVINSPIPDRPKKDKTPSFSVFVRNKRIYWKDFGYDSHYGNDVVGFVCHMEPKINNREDAWLFIKNTILKGNGTYSKSFSIEDHVEDLSYIKSELDFKYSFLEPEHYMYYEKLLVPAHILHLYKTMALKQIIKDDYAFWTERPGENIGFYNRIGSGNKGYMPFNRYYQPKTPKVIHQGIDILEGYEQLPRNGKLLILDKSLKDVQVKRAAGYFGTCMSGENAWKVFDRYYYEISERFEEIIACGVLDPDGI